MHMPLPPERKLPDEDWEHYALYRDVKAAISSVPAYFRTETQIAGVMATDLHTLNNVLGATIEAQVVYTLNSIRAVWDPDEKYVLYSFVRQPQTFPDVLLRRAADGDILLGIELKGWYVLAKEGEPSFRYRVTAAACNPQDLVVVVPWALGNVVSGSPILLDPYIESARYAAEYRNHHWAHVRETGEDRGINSPIEVKPYPAKSDQIDDKPVADGGGNFGRFARTGLMDAYLAEIKGRPLSGLRIEYWLRFLKVFQGEKSEEQTRAAIDRFARQVTEEHGMAAETRNSVLTVVRELRALTGLQDPGQ